MSTYSVTVNDKEYDVEINDSCGPPEEVIEKFLERARSRIESNVGEETDEELEERLRREAIDDLSGGAVSAVAREALHHAQSVIRRRTGALADSLEVVADVDFEEETVELDITAGVDYGGWEEVYVDEIHGETEIEAENFLEDFFEQLDEEVEKRIKEAIEAREEDIDDLEFDACECYDAAQETAEEAALEAAKDDIRVDSGTLRDSLTVDSTAEGGEITIEITPHVDYGGWEEVYTDEVRPDAQLAGQAAFIEALREC